MRRTAEAIYQELLAVRCRRGDKAALEELVRTWEKRLFYFVRRLVDEEQDAWDVLRFETRVTYGHGRQAVLLAQAGEPARLPDLVGRVPLRLHVDGRHHLVAGGVTPEVVREIAPTQRRVVAVTEIGQRGRRQPRVGIAPHVPEVLVRVDDRQVAGQRAAFIDRRARLRVRPRS